MGCVWTHSVWTHSVWTHVHSFHRLLRSLMLRLILLAPQAWEWEPWSSLAAFAAAAPKVACRTAAVEEAGCTRQAA